MEETRNVIITSTFLGVEDHGILTFWLRCESESSGQGFGGWCLDEPIRDKNGKFLRREGTERGMELLKRVVDAVGVESWEKLKGARCRVRGNHNKLFAIGHIIKDQWFEPERDLSWNKGSSRIA